MKRLREKIAYEDSKLLITRDRFNWIIREKPINPKNPYKKATYINDIDNVLWEVCECRKLYKEGSDIPQAIGRAIHAVEYP